MKKKILIVEDEADLVQTLSKRLSSAGYEIGVSMDATSGIMQMRKFKPDLLILDLMLPGGGGQAVMKALKLSTHTANIPVLVLTGMQNPTHKQNIESMGISAYMTKPYDFAEVLATIQKLLESKPTEIKPE